MYNNGWVEQGKTHIETISVSGGTTSWKTEILPITMVDNKYTNFITVNSQGWFYTTSRNHTTTSLDIGIGSYGETRTLSQFSWQVSGMAADVPTYNKIQCIKY